MKNLILQRKLSVVWSGVILYLTFCIANFYTARGMWGYANSLAGSMEDSVIIANVFVAFFAGGVIPFAFYEIISGFAFSALSRGFGKASVDFRYSFRFFYAGANILTGLLSLLYLISPLISVYGIIIAPIISTVIFAALYLIFVCKNYCDKTLWSSAILNLGGVFVIVNILLTLSSLLGVVL